MYPKKRFGLIVASLFTMLIIAALGVYLWLLVQQTYETFPQDLKYRTLASILVPTVVLPGLIFSVIIFGFAVRRWQSMSFTKRLCKTLHVGEMLMYATVVLTLFVVVLLAVLEDVGHIAIFLGLISVLAIGCTLALLFSLARSALQANEKSLDSQ